MKKLLILLLIALIAVPICALAQEKDATPGKDDMEAFGGLVWMIASPLDLLGTPIFNLWCEFWTLPARGADLLEYQDKYYYDYGTMTYRDFDNMRPAGKRPLGEYAAPTRRPRETKNIVYMPPKH